MRFWGRSTMYELIDAVEHNNQSIMQPIEAMRWIRENSGKVIVAVEDKDFMYKWEDWAIYTVCNGIWRKCCELVFFSYTYKVLGE